MRHKSNMDILREVKEILKKDFNRKQKLKYALKNKKILVLIPKIKSQSWGGEERYMFKMKLGDRKGTANIIHSNIKKSRMDVTTTVENLIMQNNNKQIRNLLPNGSVGVKDEFSNTHNVIASNDSSLMKQMDNQKKIKKKIGIDLTSQKYINNVDKNSSRLSYLLQKSFVDDIVNNELIDEDILRNNEAESIRGRTLSVSKLPSTSARSSSHSSNGSGKQNISTHAEKTNLKMEKLLRKSVEQYMTAISSGSDLSSCITPITNKCASHRSYQELEKRVSRSLSKSPRRIRNRSHSKESSRTIMSTTTCDRRSYSYSSRSSSSSQLSRCHFSGSSKSRSPSIPRRYGSPSFLERRRITSARKRPIPYRRTSPSSSPSSSNSPSSQSSRNSLTNSPCDAWSPESNRTSHSNKSQ